MAVNTYFSYGGHTHPEGEVVLTAYEVIPRYSDRGRRREATYRMHIMGELIYQGAELNQKIAELIDAYSIDDQDAVLYMPDGTPTRHALYVNDPGNISGVHVAYRSWPKGDAAELCTTRTFYIRLEAIQLEPTSEIVWWQEQVRTIGTTGPQWAMIPQASGPPVPQVIYQQTPQTIIQTGMAVGLEGYPLGRMPGPLLPQWEHLDERVVETMSPQFRGRRYTDYGIRWAYKMTSPVPNNLFPNVG